MFRKKEFGDQLQAIKSQININKDNFIYDVEDILLLRNAPLDLIMKVRNTIRQGFDNKEIKEDEIISNILNAINFISSCFSCGYINEEHHAISEYKRSSFLCVKIRKFLRLEKVN